MRKALILILTAFLIVSLFIACKNEPEPIPEITIGFEKNCESATGEMKNLTAHKGEATNLPENKYERTDGYQFTSWNTKADGSGDSYTDGDTVCFESDTTLYARWDKKVIKITFDANGGTGWMLPQWVLYDEASVLRPNRFTLEGYVFIGWNTKDDGTGTKYFDKEQITTDKDVTLYAQWAVDICALEDKYNWNESDGKYFSFSEDLTLKEHRPDVNGSIILFLPEGKTLSLGFGLGVTRGNSLTIEGTGNLEAVGTSAVYSGIGGDGETLWIACGDITINGGNIYAKGGAGGAGIGGAYCCNSGTITINGGTVEAVGGSSDVFGYEGAGIGGGGQGSNGTVIINGGKVTATGRENSDGIGKGQDGKDKGKLTLGKGVSIEVSDDNKTWSPYKSNTRHRYMRTK